MKKFSWPSFFGVIGGIAVSQALMLLIGRDGLIGIFAFCCVAGVGFWMGRRSAFKEIAKSNLQYPIKNPSSQHAPNISEEKGKSSSQDIYGDEVINKDGKTYKRDSVTGDFINEAGTRMDYIDRLRAGLES